MKTIRLTDTFSLPLNIVTLRTAIYGTSGAGKTTFNRLLAEQVHAAGQRFCAIDLKNDWWGLKSRADGAAPGLPIVVFGGPRRDVQIFPDGGRAVAETIVSIEQSCIIDLDDFTKKKQLVFLTAFLDGLYELNRNPLLLFADEADRYASQKPMSAEMHESLSASEDIARRGRKRGIGSNWLTQRYASLNKNVSDLCDLTVVFRTPGSRDLDELKERVGRVATKEQVAEVMKRAPGLEDGEAIFLSAHPLLRKLMPKGSEPIQLPMPWTFDSSSTPSVGQRRREPKILAETDLAAIEQRMSEQVERAKAEDPKAIRAELVNLRNALAAAQARERLAAEAQKNAKSRVEEKKVEVQIVKAKDLQKIERATARLDASGEKFSEIGTSAIDAARELANLLKKFVPSGSNFVFERGTFPTIAPPPFGDGSHRPPPPPLPPAAPPTAPAPAGADGEVDLPPRRHRILNELAYFGVIGIHKPPREQVAFMCDVSATSSTYEKDLGALKTAGLLIYPGSGLLQLTDRGADLAQISEDRASFTIRDFHAKVIALLPPRRAKIVGVLIRARISMTREQLASQLIGDDGKAVSPASSTFEKDLGAMKTAGLLSYPEKGFVQVTDLLFPPLPE